MATYINFYQTIQEAMMRLRGTVVLYDGEPYYIWTICSHMPDGVFRVYMSALVDAPKGMNISGLQGHHAPHGTPSMAQMMDAFVDGTSPCPITIIRKKMDSPKFNKFRPFPLGMMNDGGNAIYVERQPLRPKTEQGLTSQMLTGIPITTGFSPGRTQVSMYSPSFRDCILGDYPTPIDCLNGLLNGKNINEAAAFNRNFALVKGPIDTMFLAYKGGVVGVLPRSNFSAVKLGKDYGHLKEVTEELKLFSMIG